MSRLAAFPGSLTPGYSWGSPPRTTQSPLRKHIGLGQAESIKAIEIFWPVTGKTQRLAGVPMERFYKITEDEAAAVPLAVRTFKYRSEAD